MVKDLQNFDRLLIMQDIDRIFFGCGMINKRLVNPQSIFKKKRKNDNYYCGTFPI